MRTDGVARHRGTLWWNRWTLLARRPGAASVIVRAVAGEEAGRHAAVLALFITVASAPYGAVMGWWTSPRLAGYGAVKLPLVLLGTQAVTLVFGWMAAALLGLRLRLPQMALLTALPLAVAALLLASLAPIAWLFTAAAPSPTTAARTTHNLLYLLHTAFVGGAGLAGCAVLRQALADLAPHRSVARRVFATWLLLYTLVGGEVAWALRPFIGSVYLAEAFLRPDALDGNVYEFVFADILPHLARRLWETLP